MKKKFLAVVLLLSIGFGFGIITTSGASANSNVVLASVEWVLSKITPVETKITQLEQRVAQLENGGKPAVQHSNVLVGKATAVRKGASTSYAAFFTAPIGTDLIYNSTYKNSITGQTWYIVKLSDGRLGAVLSTDVTLQSSAITTITKIVTHKASPIRRGASNSYEIIYNASSGQVFQYSSTYTNSVTGEKWYIVKAPNGKFGAILANTAQVVK